MLLLNFIYFFKGRKIESPFTGATTEATGWSILTDSQSLLLLCLFYALFSQATRHTHTHTFNSPPLKMEKKKTGGNSTFENYSLNSEEEDEEEEERRAKENFPSSSPSDAGDHQRTHRPRVVASSMLRQVQVSCDSSPSLTRARVVGGFQLAP